MYLLPGSSGAYLQYMIGGRPLGAVNLNRGAPALNPQPQLLRLVLCCSICLVPDTLQQQNDICFRAQRASMVKL